MNPAPSKWFPRPADPGQIRVLGPGPGLPPAELHTLLHDPQARELKHKVGVMSPADGSAKVTARLLQGPAWFFKSDECRKADDPEKLVRELARPMELAGRLPLWHPKKFWFLVFVRGAWWPVSACPPLTTLRQETDWPRRLAGWTRMIEIGVKAAVEYGIGLDLNPSNFGFDPTDPGPLYYLDDEVYAPLERVDFAQAAVGRVPEEQGRPEEDWQRWGADLQATFAPCCQDTAEWCELLDAIRDYPLPDRLEPGRQALARGLTLYHRHLDPEVRRRERAAAAGLAYPSEPPTPPAPATPPPVPPAPADVPAVVAAPPPPTAPIPPRAEPPPPDTSVRPRLTLVFADVHGNLPALEAVLNAARELRVDSYLFLGDVVGYGPYPRQCLELIRSLPRAILLRGNHDQMVGAGSADENANRFARAAVEWTLTQVTEEDRAWLAALPVEYRGDRWLAVHGAPVCPARFLAYVYELTWKDNLDRIEADGVPVCFYGHSHVQFVHRRTAGGRDEKLIPDAVKLFQPGQFLLINPGAVGQPRDGDPRAPFALWDRRSDRITFHRAEYSVERVTAAVRSVGLPEDLALRLEIGR